MENTSLFGGVKWRFLSNSFQKLMSFTLNQLLIQFTSPETLGIVSIQLELLLSTVLFLSREGIRMATLRTPIHDHDKDYTKIINISWLPSIIVIFFIFHLFIFRIFSISTTTHPNELSEIVVTLYCVGALLESIGEPWYNMYQHNLIYHPRVSAEMSAVLGKSIITFILIAILNSGIYGYGVGQFVYEIIYLLTLISFSSSIQFNQKKATVYDFFPKYQLSISFDSQKFIEKTVSVSLLHSALTITGSSLLKHILTEADKIVLTLFFSSYDQGIFAFANNYGSLIARLVFMPIEDSTRLSFASIMNDIRSISSQNHTYSPIEFRMLLNQKYHDLLYFSSLLQMISLFGMIFVIFGPPYVRVAVILFLKSSWRNEEVIQTLCFYCLYIFILGVNGISEGFVQTTCNEKDFKYTNHSYLFSTITYTVTAYLFSRSLGSRGLVLASCFSMLIRIIFNFRYIHGFFTSPYNTLHTYVSNNDEKQLTSSQDSNSIFSELKFCTNNDIIEIIKSMKYSSPILELINSITLSFGLTIFLIVLSLHYSSTIYYNSDQSLKSAIQHISVGLAAIIIFIIVLLNQSFVQNNKLMKATLKKLKLI
jgi:oligosaccharide translocation protein RFT1